MASQTGTITASAQTIVLAITNNNVVNVTINGTYNSVEIVFEATVDGSNWYNIGLTKMSTGIVQSSSGILTNESAMWSTNLGSTLINSFRIRSIAHTSGTANIRITASVPSVLGDPSTGEALIGQQTSSASLPVVLASDQSNISVSLGGALEFPASKYDAFGRLRISEIFTIFDSNFVNTDGSLYWQTTTASGGTSTRNTNENVMDLTTTTTSGSLVRRRTYTNFVYQPGKSHLIFMTGNFGTQKTNVRKRIGYYDDNDGLYFQQDGSNTSVVKRSSVTGSVVNTVVNQASWNIDALDGNGPSGETFDTEKSHIFGIEFQWLGVGKVKLFVVIGDELIYVHEFLHANLITTTYMKTGSLPVTYEIENTGTAASSTTMKQICCSVQSEGGHNPLGVVRTIDTGTSSTSVPNLTFVPLISLRVGSSYTHAYIRLTNLQVFVQNADYVAWRLIWNPSLTGASWGNVSSTSIAQVDTSASSFSGGEILLSGYTAQGQILQISPELSLRLSSYSGGQDIVTIVAANTSGGSASLFASIEFKEVF